MPLLALFAAAVLQFTPQTIATGLTGGYQVLAVDMNKDGRPDLLALSSGMSELVWYENPTWQRHVVVSGMKRMINVWPMDVNRDGAPELLLAHLFENEAARSAGAVSFLQYDGKAWTIREIDRLTTSHRLRSANGLFINAPLTSASAVAPEYRGPTPLVTYDPATFERRQISAGDEGVLHGLAIFDWNKDGLDDILTASFRGIAVHLAQRDGTWIRQLITPADPAPWPKSGSSDLTVGHLGKQRLLASIEPWHGHQVAVYRQSKGQWQRQVIDDTLTDGHTILTADFDGDGRDEILAGFRQGKRGVYLYREEKGQWRRQILSEGQIAAAGCAIADFNADRKPDIACIGSATANLLLWTQN
jgi:hypothetical protein